ncbi:MAG: transposase, partial [Clostridium sp.]
GMLHYRNSLGAEEKLDPEIVAGYEERYDAILDKAQEEYEYEPPSEYYKDGYNLFIRLKKFKENELLFLHDKRVPANNSLCERLARVFKRKQKQAMAFRSQESLNYVCDGLSVVYLLRNQADSVYQKISDIFCREKPSQRINPAGSMP